MAVDTYHPKLQKSVTKVVQSITEDCDFIGMVERVDESLVIMKMLLQLDMNDILYLSAKHGGGYDDSGYKGNCTYIVPSFVSPGMKQYFESSSEWRKRTGGDLLLVQTVNKSLDLMIEALG